jgi:hypothetical protein
MAGIHFPVWGEIFFFATVSEMALESIKCAPGAFPEGKAAGAF